MYDPWTRTKWWGMLVGWGLHRGIKGRKSGMTTIGKSLKYTFKKGIQSNGNKNAH